MSKNNNHSSVQYLGKNFYLFHHSESDPDIFEVIYEEDFLNKSLENRLKMDNELYDDLKGKVIVVPFNGGLHIADKVYHYFMNKHKNLRLKFLSIENYSYDGKDKKDQSHTHFLFDAAHRNDLVAENGIQNSIPESQWIADPNELENYDGLIICDDVYDEGNSVIEIFDFLAGSLKEKKISCFYQFHKVKNLEKKLNEKMEEILDKVRQSNGKFHSALILTENKWIGGCGADIGLLGSDHAGRNIQSLILRVDPSEVLYQKVLEYYKESR